MKLSVAVPLIVNAVSLVVPIAAAAAAAAPSSPSPRMQAEKIMAMAEGGDFSLDPKLVDKLYAETATPRPGEPPSLSGGAPRGIRLQLGYTHFAPSRLDLANRYFTVPYAETISVLPAFEAQLRARVARLGDLDFSVFLAAGYGARQGIFTLRSKQGAALRDTIDLAWTPLAAGLALDWGARRTTLIKPGLSVTGGVEHYGQTGTLDGMNQDFWIPAVALGPRFLLFSPAEDASGVLGFSGLEAAALYRLGIASEQALRGWGVNVSSGLRF